MPKKDNWTFKTEVKLYQLKPENVSWQCSQKMTKRWIDNRHIFFALKDVTVSVLLQTFYLYLCTTICLLLLTCQLTNNNGYNRNNIHWYTRYPARQGLLPLIGIGCIDPDHLSVPCLPHSTVLHLPQLSSVMKRDFLQLLLENKPLYGCFYIL